MSVRFWRGLAAAMAAMAAGVALVWPYLSPDLKRAPQYIYEFIANDNFVVNMPVAYEILGIAMGVPDEPTLTGRLRTAPGFEIGVYARDIAHPRLLRFTRRGDLIVSQPRKGRILLVARDDDGDGQSDGTRVLLDERTLPHGIELIDDWLYFAEPHDIFRARLDVDSGALTGNPERVIALPKTAHHNMHTLRLGPDGWLYYTVGASCNICEPKGPREQVILRARVDGSDEQVVATGVRNVFGFDWQPGTDHLYAADIGADYRGDDFPPEELNRIEVGEFYGFPYAHGDGHPDPELGAGNEARIASGTAPVLTFGAHSTPLGLSFLRGADLPEELQGAALLAFHGSWNRTRKTGYRVASLHWRADGSIEERDFLSGFEHDEDVIGRPVDVAEGPDGAIYVSDDYAGAIYRVSRKGPS
jgi:glucose/arabinose dehydrogenase